MRKRGRDDGMRIIGIDIGGTFTDVVVYDEATRRITAAKALTRRGDEAASVLECLEEAAAGGDDLERVVHGTTIGTNAILERRGARTAVLATRGFRDLLEIGRTRRMAPNTLFDLSFRKPAPLVPRPLRFDVEERVDSAGEVLEPLAEPALREIAAALAGEEIGAVAVCYLHSYANPAHEEATRAILEDALPGVFVSPSHEVVPEYREFERLTTTVLNAFIGPLLDRYLEVLEKALRRGNDEAKLYIMASSGGVMPLARARRTPVQTVLSGPAGGVTAGVGAAKAAGFGGVITCDMGGTSTDVCLVHDGELRVTVDNLIGSMPLKVPQVDMNTVGAGGGSVAWVSPEGQIHVGPRSAGSNPGPICYGLGGREVTVTDANLWLGRLAMRRRLGGRIAPTMDRVESAIEALARGAGIDDPHVMAAGVVRIAVAKMVASIREISMSRGYDPRECVLMAFGGAGPMHATTVADELGIDRVLVPKFPGNFSAWGLLTSEIRHDFAETLLLGCAADSIDRVGASLGVLRERARARLHEDGFDDGAITYRETLDMRYLGQAFEIPIPVPGPPLSADAVLAEFHRTYARLYGHASEDQPVEIVNARLAGIVPARVPEPVAEVEVPAGNGSGGSGGAAGSDGGIIERRRVWFDEGIDDVPVLDRGCIPIDAPFPGPAIIEETGATTVVFPGWSCRRDERDTLHLVREAPSS